MLFTRFPWRTKGLDPGWPVKEGEVSGREIGLKKNDNEIKVKTAEYTGGGHAYHLGCEVESGIRPELNPISSTDLRAVQCQGFRSPLCKMSIIIAPTFQDHFKT